MTNPPNIIGISSVAIKTHDVFYMYSLCVCIYIYIYMDILVVRRHVL